MEEGDVMTTAKETTTPAKAPGTVTMFDVRQAQRDFDNHVGAHGCRPGECDARLPLWNRILDLAVKWGDQR